MKKLLFFVLNILICVGFCDAAVRDGSAVSRTKSDKSVSQTQSRISTAPKRVSSRSVVLSSRVPDSAKRSASPRLSDTNGRVAASVTTRPSTVSARSSVAAPSKKASVTARATTNTTSISGTKTGAEYEQCKKTYFSCMDQFCTLKNDSYRRCSCNDRVFDLINQRKTLEEANEKLTVFTENLDVVGMTAAQATAMRTASEGEDALTSDKSASKALLQAIMNSIRGTDSNVGGKHSDLNSINISFDTSNAFGMTDAGQAIAAYNGVALYNAVYPQCRAAVRSDCTDASLQRAITAYLMAIEQDCNTVQTAIDSTQKQLKSAVREGDAMLDLARVENRQKHNSSDLATCINEIEQAILSEEVCGANYHKCLDNGEFIDVSTGKPIAGVKDFYKLGNLLVFTDGVKAIDQKLSKISNNRTFAENFEARVKKFAAPALDKCTELASTAWSDYLDRALLDIYYAQQSKVSEIKQGCFDFISSCYINSDNAITESMASLTDDSKILINPDKIKLSNEMCTDYVESCDNMFAGNIIEDYIANRQSKDNLDACRAIVRQCFNKYGGANYENFYYPHSGAFKPGDDYSAGNAVDWFTLYNKTYDGPGSPDTPTILSPCAKQLETITACNDPEIIKQAFGGFDKFTTWTKKTDGTIRIIDTNNPCSNGTGPSLSSCIHQTDLYGTTDGNTNILNHRFLRPTGVATEVYNQIISNLTEQCANLDGRFVEIQTKYIEELYDYKACTFTNEDDILEQDCKNKYGIEEGELVCPLNYTDQVDTSSWGICSCWANGGRRSSFNIKKRGDYYEKRTTPTTSCNAIAISNSRFLIMDEIKNDTNQVKWCGEDGNPQDDIPSCVPPGI